VRVLDASSERVLTLVTCFPFYYVGSAPDRFIVRARAVGSPARAAGRPNTASF
jgi:sortase A